MKKTLCLSLLLSAPTLFAADAGAVSPEDALKNLMEGNKRFVAGKNSCANQDASRRGALANAQRPFAVVLSCSDSRVPPEVVFDQGLGDLFVVRVAGNVVDDSVLGSLEYAVEHLGAKLILVMGHERCGAVSATLQGGKPEGHVAALVKLIQPAVATTKGKPGDPLDNAVRANAQISARELTEESSILEERVKAKKIQIKAARYDLDTGEVELLK